MNFPNELVLQEQFAAAKVAVYFANPAKTTRYYGFEVKKEILEGDFQAVQQWRAEGHTNPIFGGFKFDNQKTALSKIMNGYFFEPQTVYELVTKQVYGIKQKLPLAKSTPTYKQKNQIIQQRDETTWPNRINRVIDSLLTQADKQKVVLGRQRLLQLATEINLVSLIQQLQEQQPNSYHFVLKYYDEIFVSATPERLVAVKDGQVATAAVAGSIKRGTTPLEDTKLQTELLNDHKNLQEHTYVVATIVKKLAHLAKLDTISQPGILKTPQIQHLYTPITGNLKATKTLLDVAQRLHPTPALGGIPVEWALAIIKETETFARGLFASPIGMIMPNGDGELVIGIRSMYVVAKTVRLFAGAGILAESQAQSEYQETALKMEPMMSLLENLA